MKMSSAAIRNRHIQYGHMTIMTTAEAAPLESENRKRRDFKTDRHSPSNNGINIPHALQERILAAVGKQALLDDSRTFSAWGFL